MTQQIDTTYTTMNALVEATRKVIAQEVKLEQQQDYASRANVQRVLTRFKNHQKAAAEAYARDVLPTFDRELWKSRDTGEQFYNPAIAFKRERSAIAESGIAEATAQIMGEQEIDAQSEAESADAELVFEIEPTDWDAVLGITPEMRKRSDEMEAERALQAPVRAEKPESGYSTTTFGEYGDKQRGIKSMQIFVPKMYVQPYAVEYVIENMADIGGTLEVLSVRKLVDEFGTGSWSFQDVSGDTFDWIEYAFKSFWSGIGRG